MTDRIAEQSGELLGSGWAQSSTTYAMTPKEMESLANMFLESKRQHSTAEANATTKKGLLGAKLKQLTDVMRELEKAPDPFVKTGAVAANALLAAKLESDCRAMKKEYEELATTITVKKTQMDKAWENLVLASG